MSTLPLLRRAHLFGTLRGETALCDGQDRRVRRVRELTAALFDLALEHLLTLHALELFEVLLTAHAGSLGVAV